MSKIEQIISEIEEYIDNCKFQPLSNTKIIVNKEEIEELLTELRLKTPEEIKKYQKFLNNKEAILNDAKEQSQKMLDNAKLQTEQLINEHEIMQQAYAQANMIVSQAQEEAQRMLNEAAIDANNIRIGAMEYTDNLLSDMQRMVENTMETTKSKYDGLFSALSKDLDVIINNRRELRPSEETTSEEAAAKEETEAPHADEDDYDDDIGMIEE